ncbi:MAG: SGNH/GDSL hydrolase family protein [Anaerolineales bacterium]|nr:SGNH/GDSL hydrolase family protein [Anaerolineales bacterium]
MSATGTVFGIILIVLLGIGGVVWWVLRLARKPPANNPARVARQNGTARQPVFVCVGDSLTHGNMSANYVDMLVERFPEISWVNAGVNAEVAGEVLQRLDAVIALQPDYVSVLIGTNDANLQLIQTQWQARLKISQIPDPLSETNYRRNLTEIVQRLQAKTEARIVLLSLPTIGEECEHYAFQQAVKYSQIIQEVAAEMEVAYLPLNERMTAYLQDHHTNQKYPFEKWDIAMALLGVKHLVLHTELDRISSEHGFVLHVDHLHLNTRGAEMIADLIAEFIGDAG